MARAKLETAFLGGITMKILAEMPQADAGWLIQALLAWILEDKLPDDDDIPESCFGAWIAIREESIAIDDQRKARSEAGRVAGTASANERKRTATNGNEAQQTATKPGKVQRKSTSRAPANEDEDEDIDNNKKESSPKSKIPKAASRPSTSGDSSIVETSISEKEIKAQSWITWARLCKDPVTAALDVSKEGDEKRPVYGAYLKKLGKAAFLAACDQFRAEAAADGSADNPGAALVALLKKKAAAK